jgi:ATP-dependent helicase YprA (DUF1998 family)/rubrerythrin
MPSVISKYKNGAFPVSNLHYYQTIYQRISRKTPESTVSIWGIRQPKLRQYLVKSLSEVGSHSGLLADPVFESVYAWESSKHTMKDLAGNLLQPSLIEAMDQASKERFDKDWAPYKHQLTSWKSVLKDKKSIVVTTGTGSGKTECFMVPILNDLVQEAEKTEQSLEGVRALFLYPLNALINSQRNRLRSWTQPYGKRVRFCLYNGETPENIRQERKSEVGENPNEIFDRQTLRTRPSPILVTNATMLEYMLVRHNDAPILEQSEGKLRWIVLDEAHTYMGSQAAELSLLLKRVMLAFNVKPNNIRFVATSATIGEDDQAKRQLTTFLSSLAGIDESQIKVIGGQRIVPSIQTTKKTNVSYENLIQIKTESTNSNARYQALCKSNTALSLRKILHPENKAKTLSEISQELWDNKDKTLDTLQWIDLCSATSDEKGTPFLPLRGHFFHQTTDRLWACVDQNCSCKESHDLGDDWQFGMVYTYQRQSCECGAPVFEVVFCQDCATPYLLAEEDVNERQVKQHEMENLDEFSLIEEMSSENEEEASDEERIDNSNYQQILLCGSDYDSKAAPEKLGFDRSFIEKNDVSNVSTFAFIMHQNRCPCCEYSVKNGQFYRRTFLGAPFFIGNTMPILLDACSVDDSQPSSDIPYEGRKLITFSDSRQGTARIAVKIQQESERAVLRTQVVSETNKQIQVPKFSEEDKKKYEELKILLDSQQYPTMKADFEDQFSKLEFKKSGKLDVTPIHWHDAVKSISDNNQDIRRWIIDSYKRLDESSDNKNIAEMLLLREFARRPKNQNSLETLGFVSVQYPAINKLERIPETVNRLNLSINLEDWKALLKLILDFYFREKTIANIDKSQTKWMGAKIFAKQVYPFEYDGDFGKSKMHFPKAKEKGRQNRIVRVIATALELDVTLPTHLDWVNTILKSAWEILLSAKHEFKDIRYELLVGDQAEGYALNIESLAFSSNLKNWICPYTNRFIDSTFKGISPYLPNGALKSEATCELVQMPKSVLMLDSKQKVENFDVLNNDSEIQQLRDRNLWTDMSDRIFEYSRFIRSEEHSAQQPSRKLKEYERLFEKSKINVLNCSTTMEMGVDIGGISVVEMNNVPPHPANYLQRAGRAGRRKETQSLAYTMCKNNTHEKTVFRNPKWAFETAIKAPYIKLDSDKIVQRHINSFLLAHFLKNKVQNQEKQATSLTCHWFYAELNHGKEPYIRFQLWIKQLLKNPNEKIDAGINAIKQQSGLVATSNMSLLEKTLSQLEMISQKWLDSYQKIQKEFDQLTKDQKGKPYGKKLSFDLKTFKKEYLLSSLSTSAFLPGYGFPTGLVSFDQMTSSEIERKKLENEREDRYSRLRERPTRDLAVALREYAPGAQVVLDGLVYQSEGVLLNVNEPESGFTEPQRFEAAWRCHHCGHIGYEKIYQSEINCSNCGHEIISKNIQEYLTPEAFSVYFYGETTNDITSQNYLPVEVEWVSADSEPKTLFRPEIGSYRVSDQGNIFYHSRGKHRNGYAVCLRCGRADSMTESDDLPSVFKESGHKRLRGISSGDFSCSGTEANFAVKRNITFGGTQQTDVFELYLKHLDTGRYLNQKKDEKLAWTLAVTLREGLAEIHGIDAAEMGYLVKPIDLEGGNKTSAIVLYDKNGGGSGFASTGYKHLTEMFKKAKLQLHCSLNCETACQSCLIDFETRYQEDKLDRKIALKYIENIEPFLTLSHENQILGEKTQYCYDTLMDELLYLGYKGDSELTIYLSGNYADWCILDSDLKGRLKIFKELYKVVVLVLPSSNIESLGKENKEDLYYLQHFLEVQIKIGSSMAENALLLASVKTSNTMICFASDKPVHIPNEDLWNFSDAICVKAEIYSLTELQDFNARQLDHRDNMNTADIVIHGDLDGHLPEFGRKFWTKIIESLDVFRKTFDSKTLVSIHYVDRYINSPWVVLILHNVFNFLKEEMFKRWQVGQIVLLSSDICTEPKGPLIARSFESGLEKRMFIERYLDDLAKTIDIQLKNTQDIPHARMLTMQWDDGTQTTIRLDHGFGNWNWDGSINQRVEKSLSWLEQIEVIKKVEMQKNLMIKNKENYPAYFVVKSLKKSVI